MDVLKVITLSRIRTALAEKLTKLHKNTGDLSSVQSHHTVKQCGGACFVQKPHRNNHKHMMVISDYGAG